MILRPSRAIIEGRDAYPGLSPGQGTRGVRRSRNSSEGSRRGQIPRPFSRVKSLEDGDSFYEKTAWDQGLSRTFANVFDQLGHGGLHRVTCIGAERTIAPLNDISAVAGYH